jgi:hypothetical protein
MALATFCLVAFAPRTERRSSIGQNWIAEADTLIVQWAERHGMPVRETNAAHQIPLPNGLGAIHVYPSFSTVEVPLAPLRHRGRHDAAETVWQLLVDATGRPGLPNKHPNLVCDAIVANWDAVQTALDMLVAEALVLPSVAPYEQ